MPGDVKQNIDEEANYSALASNGLSNDDQAAPVSDSPARDRDTDSDDGSLDEQTDELKMLAAFKNQAHQDLKRRGRTISISEDFASDDLAYEKVSTSANYLMERTKHRPKIAIICGSGLAGLADLLDEVDDFPYTDIPNFPETSVPGHKSRLLFGLLRGVCVMLMQGRFHAYEGYPLAKTAMPVRVMKLCGVEVLIATNAAGGLNADYRCGDIMVLKDHINIPGFTGLHPLKGPNDNRFGSRFFALNDCYDKKFRRLAQRLTSETHHEKEIHQGVYAMLGGPNFETVAELRMLRVCGVDAVGMSTIPEVLVAAHCGIRVFAFSLITNECILEEDSEEMANHEEVIATANEQKEMLMDFVGRMVEGIRDVRKEEEAEKEKGAKDKS